MCALVLAAAIVQPAPMPREADEYAKWDEHVQGLLDHFIEDGVIEATERQVFANFTEDGVWESVSWRFDQVDLPPAADRFRLPPGWVCTANWQAASEAVNRFNRSAPWMTEAERTELLLALDEQKQRVQAWYLMACIRNSTYSWKGHRSQLHELRRLVGRDAYDRGDWPDPVRW